MPTIPHDFDCDKSMGFLPDPNNHKRVGYLTQLKGLNGDYLFQADMTVSTPWTGIAGAAPQYAGIALAEAASSKPTNAGITLNGNLPQIAKVVGVIEKYHTDGGVGSPIEIDFWCSQENAVQLKTMQQTTLSTTRISQLGWWILDYDQEQKRWFEACFPVSAPQISCIVTGKESPSIDVDLNGAPVIDGVDVNAYHVKIGVAPAANQAYSIMYANSLYKPTVKAWGLVVGTIAAQAMTG